MGSSCGKNVMADTPTKVSSHMRKELGRISQSEDCIRIHGRYHHLPKRLVDDYQLTSEVLGHGMSGEVYVAFDNVCQRKVAVKTLRMRNLSKQQRKHLVSEIVIHLSVDHPNIATLLDVYESEDQIQLVTEFIDGGALIGVAKNDKHSESSVAAMVKQMLLAVQYIHHKNIVHRDIKAENFLVEKTQSGEGAGLLKLIDFGVSKHIGPESFMNSMNSTGTLAYTAPEVLQNFYNFKCDIWSLGVITFILLVGYMPFYGNPNQMRAMILRGHPMNNGPKDRWKQISSDAKQFIASMFKMSPVDRISAEQALQHCWIVNYGMAHQTSVPVGPLGFAKKGIKQFAYASRFRRACMLIMSWSVNPVEKDMLYEAFVDLDKDGTGIVNVDALVQKIGLPAKEADRLCKFLGINYIAGFRYTDFLAALTCGRACDQADMVQEVFRRFDINHNGVVGKTELQMILGEDFDCEDVLARFPDSQITCEDFLQYLSEGMDPVSPKSPKVPHFDFNIQDMTPLKKFSDGSVSI